MKLKNLQYDNCVSDDIALKIMAPSFFCKILNEGSHHHPPAHDDISFPTNLFSDTKSNNQYLETIITLTSLIIDAIADLGFTISCYFGN